MVLWMRCTGGATVSDPCRVQLQLSTTVNNSKLSGFSRRWWSASIEEHFKFFHQKRATRYCTPFLLVWTTSDSSEMACAFYFFRIFLTSNNGVSDLRQLERPDSRAAVPSKPGWNAASKKSAELDVWWGLVWGSPEDSVYFTVSYDSFKV